MSVMNSVSVRLNYAAEAVRTQVGIADFPRGKSNKNQKILFLRLQKENIVFYGCLR